MGVTPVTIRLTTALVALGLLAAILPGITGCRRQPSVTFLDVPPASFGGSGSTGLIRGHVDGSRRGRHVVLYAFADSRWWVQPFASAPRTEIADDGSWQAKIHLGTEYAALLVNEDKLPPPVLEDLPTIGKAIEAVAVTKGGGRDLPSPGDLPGATPFRFSGLDWTVRTYPGDYASKTNEYSAGNVFVDDAGALHMRLSRSANGWTCSEIHSVRSFGYGTYQVNLRDADHLEPAIMFSVFTYLEKPRDGDHRELAIHLTRRGVASNTNAEFTIQPSFVPTNFYHFNVPPGPLKLSLNWSPEEAEFAVSPGQTFAAEPIVSWPFKTGVPTADDTHLFLNLCNYGYAPVPPTHNAEVVVKSFEFYP